MYKSARRRSFSHGIQSQHDPEFQHEELCMMMKFLLHSWLRPDGICTIYIYYVTSNILDPSGNAPLSLARVPACEKLCSIKHDPTIQWWDYPQLQRRELTN